MANTSKILVIELVDRFLVLQKKSGELSTYKWYCHYLRAFAHKHGNLPACTITPSTMGHWLANDYHDLAPSTQNAAARCVTRLFNWAVNERLLLESPLRGFRKPAPSSRETTITPKQYAACLRLASPAVKVAIKFLYHTGCRPLEMRVIESKHVQGAKIVLPLHLSKGKRKRRIIYLDDMARRIIVLVSKSSIKGPVFRTPTGKPWTRGNLGYAVKLLGTKAGIGSLVPYNFRHAFITRLLERGVDVATVAALAGNSPRMVLDVYNHIGNNESRLLGVL